MSVVKCFNNLLLIENLFGIYRNYPSQKNIMKRFIIFQVFVQIMFHTIVVIYGLLYMLGGFDYNQNNLMFAGFLVSSYLSSTTSVMAGICYSRAFRLYYISIHRVSECFKDDNKFNNFLKKIYWFSISFIIYSIAFAAFRSADTFTKFSQFNLLILVPIMISQAIMRITLLLQNLMMFLTIMIVADLSKCLTSLILAVQERVGSCHTGSEEHVRISREQIQGWVEIYRDLANCCEKITLCFGRQFILSLILSILHYILLPYYIFYNNILYIGSTEEDVRIVIVLFGHISVMMMPLVAGQITNNQGEKLHRVLVRLYTTMIIGEVEAKLIKDFIRLIKKNPIEIKLSTHLLAGMYLLPVILTLAVNYLIVMLQFNHII